MMTSVSNDRCRGAREKTQISATQATQPQKQVVQATAEQMRLAQVIFDKNDSDFEAKVKQLMEVTGKNQDECIVALHDCNGDINKAINILLEGSSDTTSWETVGGKKKNFGKESSENKENREKRSEREAIRGRGNRKGRGSNRGREIRGEENGLDCNQRDKTADLGKRARVRGFGRGRGRGTGRFSAQSMGTFNPADYSDSTKVVVWEAAQNGANEGSDRVWPCCSGGTCTCDPPASASKVLGVQNWQYMVTTQPQICQTKVPMELKVPGKILWRSGQQKTGRKIFLKQKSLLPHVFQQRMMSRLGKALT
ncbi:ubiquitin-associated protein 2 isoform X6 [Cavia porcellus]|uniref:ubiquitin-associated protein 2 isoform X6 n=1 Tax=Cavia porcellus TaxID=10141 RepID=UPI002FE0AB1D